MKKTQIKDIVRNIRTSVVSWLAVVIVVTITCGVYCGVFYYADALEDKAAGFFEQTAFEDLTVTSAKGMTAEEIRKLLAVPGVLDAEGTYQLSGAALQIGQRSHSASILAVTKRISVPELREGSLPEAGMECAMTADAMARLGLRIGDTVKLKLGGIPPLSFKLTGSVRHPAAYYLSESLYVFVPASTMEQLFGGDRCPVVLVDAACGGALLSDTYFDDLSPVRAGVQAAMEELSASGEADAAAEASGFVITARMDRESFLVLRQIVEILRKLATIFVVIFVIIGAIVVTSTITVVIDGQKRQIGFLKAYGFRNGEIIRRYLVYGESAVVVGMVCAVGVAFLLQIVLRRVLGGMFCLEIERFTFQPGSCLLLLLLEAVLAGAITSWVTVSNASKYEAMELLGWNGSIPASGRRRRAVQTETASRATLYSRLIFRNICSDWVRVIASTIIIAGCCFMIGIGLTLNSAFHSMTKNTRKEVARYDLECTLRDGRDLGALEDAVRGGGADCVRVSKAQTVYGFEGHEEYITVVAAGTDVYQDYLCLIGADGKPAPVPDTGHALIQNRISERLGVGAGDDIVLFDGALGAHPIRIAGTARNYLGRVVYLSEATFASVFGDGSMGSTLLVRLNGADRDAFSAMLTERFPDVEIACSDSMPSLFSGLEDAFNALIYVLITLSVIMSVFVLLNLVNIFVSRRKNELIIMGVNGFSYREEIGYLLRETVATTAAGLVFGVLFGALVTKPIVQIIEASDTMCARSVNWKAWAAGMAMEAVFALLINLYSFRRVKHYSINDLK